MRHNISIHALLAESDKTMQAIAQALNTFLSTLSLRRATPHRIRIEMACRNFYPRSPCGERPSYKHIIHHKEKISIHALLAESDEKAQTLKVTPLCISIHALLAESDRPFSVLIIAEIQISIHALLAESDNIEPFRDCPYGEFLSTLSLRRATS